MKYMYFDLSFCPEQCPYLDLTEDTNKKYYFCKKYNKHLSQKTFHPKVVMLGECDVFDDIKKNKDD